MVLQDIDNRSLPAPLWRRPQHWLGRLRPALDAVLRPAQGGPRRLSLALQGGGSLGAFTWGVLDRLLEEEGVMLDAVSGASAGAVNAVVLADGLAAGGPREAQRRLERVWQRISKAASLVPAGEHPVATLLSGNPFLNSAATAMASLALDFSAKILSPYQTNPLDINPLRDILAQEVDFERLRRAAPMKLLVSATRVRDGGARIFRNDDISLEAVMASTSLPSLHHAVDIDGEWYWDGGISANPPLLHLAATSRADDLLLVQLTPCEHDDLPRDRKQITKRLNEIVFGLPLRRELDLLAITTELHRRRGIFGSALGRKLQRLRLHRLAAEDSHADLQSASPLNLDWTFLTGLRDSGRRAADDWLKTLA
jgi:NTE family protein